MYLNYLFEDAFVCYTFFTPSLNFLILYVLWLFFVLTISLFSVVHDDDEKIKIVSESVIFIVTGIFMFAVLQWRELKNFNMQRTS